MSEESNGLKIGQGDGTRLRALKEALNHLVEKILEGWNAPLYTMCFPTFAERNGEVLEAIRASLLVTVANAIYEDLNSIVDEDVSGSLERLGNLVKSYSGSKDVQAWRPSGDPSLDMGAHDAKVLQYEKECLLQSLEAAKKTSDKLMQKVEAGRKECQDNHKEIQERLSALKELAHLSKNISRDEHLKALQENI